MQVTYQADHITHAMLGGAKTREFGITNDAAFFQILSSTLYSDQKLAVAREVLCNAWDAHIRAGRTDTPVIVTITDTKLIVQDSGMGIHDDMMGPLYGTYGGSDKKNNGTETGGFGLGCKSPFAYGDHFEVVSCHEGTKTIYNLSKSSADRFGKPGITTIVSLPTTETGLQVTIPLKTPYDESDFTRLFREVAFNGEMNVIINGVPVEGIPLSKSDYNWIITTKSPLSTAHCVLVRYGNVIYPVKEHTEYDSEYKNVIRFLQRLKGNNYRSPYRIIFQAEPDTISVTPSRESLSMQEHTINSLKKLFEGFVYNKQDFDRDISKESWNLLDEQILKVAEKKQIGLLMSSEKSIPGLESEHAEDLEYIGNISQIAQQYTRTHYPQDAAFYRRDMGLRLDMAITLGVGRKGHLNQVKHQLVTPSDKLGYVKTQRNSNGHTISWREKPEAHEWFKRSVLRPLVRDIAAHPMLDLKRFYINSDRYLGLTSPMHYRRESFGDYLPILRNILVISYTIKDLKTRLYGNFDLQRLGGKENVWIYHAPMAKTRIEATREFFKSKGFHVIDLTVEEEVSKYRVPKVIPDPNKPKAVKKSGYAALSGVNAQGKMTRVDNCFLPEAPHITKPLCYLRVSTSSSLYRSFELGRFDSELANRVTKLFGDVCAVIRNDTQANKLKEKGLMELSQYVIEYVTKAVTSPNFLTYWEEDLNRALGNKTGVLSEYQEAKAIVPMFDCNELRTLLGLTQNLNAQDQLILVIWRTIVSNPTYYEKYGGKLIETAADIIKALPIGKAIADISAKTNNNKFFELININQFKAIAAHPNAKADGHLDRLAKLVQIALMG